MNSASGIIRQNKGVIIQDMCKRIKSRRENTTLKVTPLTLM